MKSETSKNFWVELKQHTQARVGLKRSGHAIGTEDNLKFQWAHAQARDAIHSPWNIKKLEQELKKLESVNPVILETQVKSRVEYLARPDLGRLLKDGEAEKLERNNLKSKDILLIVSNGLSSNALEEHALRFLNLLISYLKNKKFSFNIVLVENARVGLSDVLGDLLKPKLSLILIGERPGLSSPDSMGIYLTYNPSQGKTDADRNCISNIRAPYGLSYELALNKTSYLIEQSLHKKLSGVALKDESERFLLSP